MTKGLRILFLIFLCSLSLSFVTTAYAREVSFGFEDTNAKKNRIFDIPFYAVGEGDVSAFVMDVTFDSEMLSYRGYTLSNEHYEAQANLMDDGHLKLVFLCEESVDCKDKTTLITFNFKALKEGKTDISAQISDVINSDCEEIAANCSVATVSIEKALKDENSADRDNITETDALSSEASGTKDEAFYSTRINASSKGNKLFLPIVILVLLLCMVGYIFYKLGVKASAKNNEKRVEDEDKS